MNKNSMNRTDRDRPRVVSWADSVDYIRDGDLDYHGRELYRGYTTRRTGNNGQVVWLGGELEADE